MKHLFLAVIFIVLFSSPLLAADKTCEKNKSVATVDGMVCDFCVQSITKVLKKNDAVNDVVVDLTAKTVTVDLKQGTSLDDKEIAKAIDYAGYKLVKIDHACQG
jgi:copper chaperone CopZ